MTGPFSTSSEVDEKRQAFHEKFGGKFREIGKEIQEMRSYYPHSIPYPTKQPWENFRHY